MKEVRSVLKEELSNISGNNGIPKDVMVFNGLP